MCLFDLAGKMSAAVYVLSILLAMCSSNCSGRTAEEWKGRIIYQVSDVQSISRNLVLTLNVFSTSKAGKWGWEKCFASIEIVNSEIRHCQHSGVFSPWKRE